jgi:cyclopropane fatty-acyl-phospholipid synthase-like methyltransferase
MSVAEIGCGWGAFAIHLARETGARVTAINVSPKQLRIARERAAAAGVADRIEFREIDYRQLDGRFDRVVSVGMMEHVGIGHFDEYFGKIRGMLADDGYAFLHCIGRNTPPGTTGPFIRKYISQCPVSDARPPQCNMSRWATSRPPHCSRTVPLFDHIVGEGNQLVRHGEAKRLGSLEVDDQLKFVAQHDG